MRNLSIAVLLAASTALAADVPYRTGKGWKPLLNGKDLSGWTTEHGKPLEWTSEGGVIRNGPRGRTDNLVTTEKFGDVELYLEFMIPKGSNSGVYLQGLYEIQIFDSYGKTEMTTSDGGAIYHQWINEKPVGGSAPKVNASLAPGEWQSYHAWFRAPRFDKSGKKIENAKFVKVLHNGKLVQENFSVDGPTRAHMEIAEAPLNPIMLQGDHGPVSYRNIYIRKLN
jgi:hypothetical protein